MSRVFFGFFFISTVRNQIEISKDKINIFFSYQVSFSRFKFSEFYVSFCFFFP